MESYEHTYGKIFEEAERLLGKFRGLSSLINDVFEIKNLIYLLLSDFGYILKDKPLTFGVYKEIMDEINDNDYLKNKIDKNIPQEIIDRYEKIKNGNSHEEEEFKRIKKIYIEGKDEGVQQDIINVIGEETGRSEEKQTEASDGYKRKVLTYTDESEFDYDDIKWNFNEIKECSEELYEEIRKFNELIDNTPKIDGIIKKLLTVYFDILVEIPLLRKIYGKIGKDILRISGTETEINTIILEFNDIYIQTLLQTPLRLKTYKKIVEKLKDTELFTKITFLIPKNIIQQYEKEMTSSTLSTPPPQTLTSSSTTSPTLSSSTSTPTLAPTTATTTVFDEIITTITNEELQKIMIEQKTHKATEIDAFNKDQSKHTPEKIKDFILELFKSYNHHSKLTNDEFKNSTDKFKDKFNEEAFRNPTEETLLSALNIKKLEIKEILNVKTIYIDNDSIQDQIKNMYKDYDIDFVKFTTTDATDSINPYFSTNPAVVEELEKKGFTAYHIKLSETIPPPSSSSLSSSLPSSSKPIPSSSSSSSSSSSLPSSLPSLPPSSLPSSLSSSLPSKTISLPSEPKKPADHSKLHVYKNPFNEHTPSKPAIKLEPFIVSPKTQSEEIYSENVKFIKNELNNISYLNSNDTSYDIIHMNGNDIIDTYIEYINAHKLKLPLKKQSETNNKFIKLTEKINSDSKSFVKKEPIKKNNLKVLSEKISKNTLISVSTVGIIINKSPQINNVFRNTWGQFKPSFETHQRYSEYLKMGISGQDAYALLRTIWTLNQMQYSTSLVPLFDQFVSEQEISLMTNKMKQMDVGSIARSIMELYFP
jgi:hypothetical protein